MDKRDWASFAEPRGWALEWVFSQEPTHPTEQQTPEQAHETKVFVEPQGWALQWDGSALLQTPKH